MNPPLNISSHGLTQTEQIDDREIYFSNLSEGVVVRLDARPRPAQARAAGSRGSEMLRDLHGAEQTGYAAQADAKLLS